MKLNRTILLIATLIVTWVVAGISGCASSDAKNQESMLTAAGFRVRTPETAQQKAVYDAAPAYKLQRGDANGKIFYLYKDEKQGIAYVGGETEYQRYQQLAIQQKIAEDNYQAAQLNNQAAWGWYNAWGPRTYW